MLNLIKEKLINEYRRRLNYLKQVIAVFLYSIMEDYTVQKITRQFQSNKRKFVNRFELILFLKEKI